jgi:myo-inositol 2-dehydrogenase / D-chiro-inositol 1-dehydrogenase
MSTFSRRHALTGAAANLLIVRPETAFSYQANSKVTFGIIGTGGRGRYDGAHMTRDANAQLAAICDLYPDRIDLGKTQIPGGDKVPAYKDFHELLAQPGLDAVLITTPVYLHPVHFEAAVAAKKHIYCEKPAGADVAGVKRLLAASAKADKSKTIQFGFQQRYSPEYLTAEKILRDGRMGELTMMESFWVLGGLPPRGTPKTSDAPEVQKLRQWGAWMSESGGAIVEQDCHGVDTLNWFAGNHPTRAVGTGGLRYKPAYGDWDSDHHNITYYYPNNMEGWLISIKHTCGFRDVKERFYGSKGMLETARTYYRFHGPTATAAYKHADDLSDSSQIERRESKREITIDAIEVFFKSIVDKKPHNMAQAAAESTLTSILGRMAYQKKRVVTWDEMMKSA